MCTQMRCSLYGYKMDTFTICVSCSLSTVITSCNVPFCIFNFYLYLNIEFSISSHYLVAVDSRGVRNSSWKVWQCRNISAMSCDREIWHRRVSLFLDGYLGYMCFLANLIFASKWISDGWLTSLVFHRCLWVGKCSARGKVSRFSGSFIGSPSAW